MFKRGNLSLNTLLLLSGSLVNLLLGLALSVMIARTSGEAGLGLYVGVLSYLFPLMLLAEFGTNTLLTRDTAAYPTQEAAMLRQVSALRLRIGLALCVLLNVSVGLLNLEPSLRWGFWLASPLLLIEPAFGAYSALLRAHQWVLPLPALNIGMMMAQVALGGAVLASGGGGLGVLAINTLTSAARLWAIQRLYRWKFTPYQTPQHPTLQAPILARSAPFALAGVSASTQARLNPMLLLALQSEAAAGIYGAATRFIDAARLLPQAYFDMLLPTLSAARTQPAHYKRLLLRAAWQLAAFGGAVALLASMGGTWLITTLYGDSFAEAGRYFIALAWLLPLMLWRSLWVVHHYAQGHEQLVNRVLLVMATLHAALGAGAILTAGIWGALGALAFTECMGMIALLVARPR